MWRARSSNTAARIYLRRASRIVLLRGGVQWASAYCAGRRRWMHQIITWYQGNEH